MKRRSFIQLTSAALLTAKGLLRWGNGPAPQTLAAQTVTPRVESAKQCCYVYNPGMDIDGVWDLTRQIRTIPGGVVTRIANAEEWLDANRVGHDWDEYQRESGNDDAKHRPLSERYASPGNDVRIEEIDVYWDTEKRVVITHPARELADNLIGQLTWRASSPVNLIEIKEWRDRPVDLKHVNGQIAGTTYETRERALCALPRAWRMSNVLRDQAIESLRDNKQRVGDILKRRLIETNGMDTWQVNAAVLFGVSLKMGAVAEVTARLLGIDLKKARAEYQASQMAQWQQSQISFKR